MTNIHITVFTDFYIIFQTNAFQWKIVFWVSAFIFFLGNLIFMIMGKAKVQPFNEIPGNYNCHNVNKISMIIYIF